MSQPSEKAAQFIDIKAADARAYEPRPKGYGVEVIPGAFTLWNQRGDPAVVVTADLTDCKNYGDSALN